MLTNITEELFNQFNEIRYVAIYKNNQLISKQRGEIEESSAVETDKFEELLVNPTLLTLATQRGNIDCGGLRFLIIAYGNFYQLVKEIEGGHISICLSKECNINNLPFAIISFLTSLNPGELKFIT